MISTLLFFSSNIHPVYVSSIYLFSLDAHHFVTISLLAMTIFIPDSTLAVFSFFDMARPL